MTESCGFTGCQITRKEAGGITLSIPKCCYKCHLDKDICTEINDGNSVVLSCECEIAVCQTCAKALIALQEHTFLQGLACPVCAAVSKDIFVPRTYNKDCENKSILRESSVDEVDNIIDRLIDGTYKFFGLHKVPKKERILSELLKLFSQNLIYDNLESVKVFSVDDFFKFSVARQRLAIARIEAERTAVNDPLDALRFLMHTSLLYAIKLANKQVDDGEVDSECVYCMDPVYPTTEEESEEEPEEESEQEPVKHPVQYICPTGCRYVLCQCCAPKLLRGKELARVRSDPNNNYDQIVCLTCKQLISCFCNSKEAQEIEDTALQEAIDKFSPGSRRSTRNGGITDGKLKVVFDKLHSLGLTVLLSDKSTVDFDEFKLENNTRMELAALAAHYMESHDQIMERGTRSKKGSATPEVAVAAPVVKELKFPAVLALQSKRDVFYEKCLQFKYDMEEYIPPPVEKRHKLLTEVVKENGDAIYDYSEGGAGDQRWLKIDNYVILPSIPCYRSNGTDADPATPELDSMESVLGISDSPGGRVVGLLTSPLYGKVPDVECQMVELPFSSWSVLYDPPPDKRLDLAAYQKGICVSTKGEANSNLHVILGDPSDEPNEISAAMRNIQQCYQKLCRFIVKKSTDYKNSYSFGGSIVLFNNDLGGKPWLGVLKKAEISGCAVEEEKLMQIICNLFFQSKLFSRQCQFMKFCVNNLPRRGIDVDTRTAVEMELDNKVTEIQSALSSDGGEVENRTRNQAGSSALPAMSRRSVPSLDVAQLSEQPQLQPPDSDSAVLDEIHDRSWRLIGSVCRGWNKRDKISPADLAKRCRLSLNMMGAVLRASDVACDRYEELSSEECRKLSEYVVKAHPHLGEPIVSTGMELYSRGSVGKRRVARIINDSSGNESESEDIDDKGRTIVKDESTLMNDRGDGEDREDKIEATAHDDISEHVSVPQAQPTVVPVPSKIPPRDPRLRMFSDVKPSLPLLCATTSTLSSGCADKPILIDFDEAYEEQYNGFVETLRAEFLEIEEINSHLELVTCIRKLNPDCLGDFTGSVDVPRGCVARSNPIYTVLNLYLKSKISNTFEFISPCIAQEYPALSGHVPSLAAIIGDVRKRVLRKVNTVMFAEIMESFKKFTELTFIANVIPELVSQEVTFALTKLCLCHFYYYDVEDDVYFVRLPMPGFPVLRLNDTVTSSYIHARIKEFNSRPDKGATSAVLEDTSKRSDFQRVFPPTRADGGENEFELSDVAIRAKEFIRNSAIALKLKVIANAKVKVTGHMPNRMRHATFAAEAPRKLETINCLMKQKEEDVKSAKSEMSALKPILQQRTHATGYNYECTDKDTELALLTERMVFLSDEVCVTELELSALRSAAQQQNHIIKLLKIKSAVQEKKKFQGRPPRSHSRSTASKPEQRRLPVSDSVVVSRPNNHESHESGSRTTADTTAQDPDKGATKNRPEVSVSDSVQPAPIESSIQPVELNTPNYSPTPFSTSTVSATVPPPTALTGVDQIGWSVDRLGNRDGDYGEKPISYVISTIPSGNEHDLRFSPCSQEGGDDESRPRSRKRSRSGSRDRLYAELASTRSNYSATFRPSSIRSSCTHVDSPGRSSSSGRRDYNFGDSRYRRWSRSKSSDRQRRSPSPCSGDFSRRGSDQGSRRYRGADSDYSRNSPSRSRSGWKRSRSSSSSDRGDLRPRWSRRDNDLTPSRYRDFRHEERSRSRSRSRQKCSRSPSSNESDRMNVRSSARNPDRRSRSRSPHGYNRDSFDRVVRKTESTVHRKTESSQIVEVPTSTPTASGSRSAPAENSFNALRGKYTALPEDMIQRPRMQTKRNRPKCPPRYISTAKQQDYKISRQLQSMAKRETFKQKYAISSLQEEVKRSSGDI